MRGVRICLCLALLLAMAALRLLYPAEAALARAWLGRTLDPAGNCRAAALELGRELDTAGLRGGLVAVFRQAGEALP